MQIIGEELKNILRTKEEWERNEEGIYITSPQNDFNPNLQVTEDAIDLRISDRGFIMNEEYKDINTLSKDSFDKHFNEESLSLEGYVLQPGEILYIGTLERISLRGPYVGRIVGRSTYARLGLSISTSQDKFCGYNNAIVGVQLRNNSKQGLRIYPYQKLVQILFYKTLGTPKKTESAYADEAEYRLPRILEKERRQYDENTADKISRIPSRKHNILSKTITRIKNTKNGVKLFNIILGATGTFVTALVGFGNIDNFSKIIWICVIMVIYLVFSILLNVFIDSEK